MDLSEMVEVKSAGLTAFVIMIVTVSILAVLSIFRAEPNNENKL